MSMFPYPPTEAKHKLTTAIELQTEQPQLYTSLTNSLSPEERTVVESAVAQADVIARKAAEEAAAAGASA